MDLKENNIEALLPRYCEGIATEEERRLVESWIQESEEHRRIVKQMEMLYLAADTVYVMNKVNTEKALAKVKGKRIGKGKVAWWEWAKRVAAVLFLPLLAAFFVQYYGGKGKVVQMLEARTNPGMTTSLVLPDSTVVYLNSESSLRYPSTFKGSNARKVELSGEAFFEVTKDAKKRFIVATSHQSQIEVLGTSFNVEAYEDMPDVSTTLIEGKVNFSFQSDGRRRQVALKPGQKAVYDSSNGAINLHKTSGETETSWKDGKIIFNNTPLKEALYILGKRYNVVFTQTNVRLDESFTGTFTSQRLERILEYFRLASGIRWRYIDGKEMSQQKTHIEIY
ncbi:MAG: FecR domain-containing protein [Bacteroides sp.]|nr:FecR domain-containing protein [Bacteroides sp.]